GGHVVDLLVDRGEEVRALVRPEEAGESVRRLERLGVAVCRGDLADSASAAQAVAGADRVLHCAARTGPWGPRREYQAANVTGLGALLDAALDAGVRRFVHVSSITVHGNDVRGTADETAPLRIERNPYSWSKVLGERLLERAIAERRAPVTIVRPGWVYGPRDSASFGRFAAMIRQGKMVRIGSGANHLPLIYVGDVARGILLASEAERAVGRAYILVNDEPVTQRDYLEAIAAELGVAPPRRHVPYRPALAAGVLFETLGRALRRRQPPPLMRYGVQMLGGENRFVIRRAREEIGFSPRVSLTEGVRRGIAWYRSAFPAADGRKEE
ncbi:MAG: NAD-dependent epimerase/dehydratase family protein, partial [Armatimonadetes bacterium]|nr:NAD-dependent epimerase/dehydratase family protein [Armatimonadota bacterium]